MVIKNTQASLKKSVSRLIQCLDVNQLNAEIATEKEKLIEHKEDHLMLRKGMKEEKERHERGHILSTEHGWFEKEMQSCWVLKWCIKERNRA